MKYLVLAGTFVAALAAQGGHFSVGGIVVNAATGEPVKHALVTLSHFRAVPRSVAEGAPTQPGAPFRGPLTVSAMTDAFGTFRFDALDEGEYSVTAQKPQFTFGVRQPDAMAGLNHLHLTASRDDLRIPLSPFGVITGKVVDQDGQPVAHVNVIGVSVHIQNGYKQTRTDRSAATDDRGVYRFWNVTPGRYYIKAAGRSGGTYTYQGDVPPWFTSDEGFAAVYSGGAQTLDATSPVVIEPGTEANSNVTVRLEPAYRIRGSLANLLPSPAAKFELFAGEEDTSASRVSINVNSGRFEIQDVVSGAYTLRATQGKSVAEIPVKVAGGDVNGASMTLAPGVDVEVTYRVSGGPPAKTGDDDNDDSEPSCGATLHPATRRIGSTYSTPVNIIGVDTGRIGPNSPETRISGVLPGDYHVEIHCFGAYVGSAIFGSQDVLANPVITIQPSTQQPALDIVGQRGAGSVTGKVTMNGAAGNQSFGILLVPQFSESPGPEMGFTHPGENGDIEFEFENLAPGAYVALAFSKPNDEEYRSPDFLRSLSGGVPVQVTGGHEATLTLTGVVR